MSLWKYYKLASMNKLDAAYVKFIKIFFGYAKYSSVTMMLLELGLPSFNTISGTMLAVVLKLVQAAQLIIL